MQKRIPFSFSHFAVALIPVIFLPCCSPAEAEAPPTTIGGAATGSGAKIRISPGEAKQIGAQIWKNECGGTVAGLTSWNAGEDFASLGIGHFLWYYQGGQARFEESFPPLVRYIQSRGAAVPAVAKLPACPWRSRAEFLASQNSPQMRDLRTFLHKTIPLQTEFILKRLEAALPKMLAEVPAAERDIVSGRFYAVASTPKGKYALMDYVNFKGEGTKKSERYKGQGWGMLQVLQEMRGAPRGNAAVIEYAGAADRVLTRRVANAPKNESRWLAGWRNRLKTYRP